MRWSDVTEKKQNIIESSWFLAGVKLRRCLPLFFAGSCVGEFEIVKSATDFNVERGVNKFVGIRWKGFHLEMNLHMREILQHEITLEATIDFKFQQQRILQLLVEYISDWESCWERARSRWYEYDVNAALLKRRKPRKRPTMTSLPWTIKTGHQDLNNLKTEDQIGVYELESCGIPVSPFSITSTPKSVRPTSDSFPINAHGGQRSRLTWHHRNPMTQRCNQQGLSNCWFKA
jgi:hypothetical protein